MTLFLLFLLGAITYIIVRRVTSITRTPWWVLWLVAMTPAFIWTGWALIAGSQKTMPAQLVIVPFIVCLLLYWFLIQWGRIPSPAGKPSAPSNPGTDSPREPQPESSPTRPINRSEEVQLQGCFPWSVYYLQKLEYRAQAIICHGQLKSKPEVAYETVRENVSEKFGDRFYLVFQEGPIGKPVFVLVPNPRFRPASTGEGGTAVAHALPQERITRPLLAIALLLATFCTTTLAWLELATKPERLSPEIIARGLPYAFALMTILGVHELAHYLAARRYRIKATLPYFIPVLPFPLFPFGTFGAFIQIRSPIPNRRALFDLGIAGPLAGVVVAIPLLWWGLAHSDIVPLPAQPQPFNFQALNPNFSLLLALFSKLALGQALTPETAIRLHPVAVASCLGLVVTAFNLMPIGQLDGGHIVHAMFGQRMGATIGQIARFLLLMLSLAQSHLLVWAILLFLISVSDEPALNDVTELDDRRDFWGLVALGLLLLIILPTPAFVGRWLNL